MTQYFTFEIKQIKQETDKAILVEFLVSGKIEWLPKSKIKIEGNKITIPEWLKKKLNL